MSEIIVPTLAITNSASSYDRRTFNLLWGQHLSAADVPFRWTTDQDSPYADTIANNIHIAPHRDFDPAAYAQGWLDVIDDDSTAALLVINDGLGMAHDRFGDPYTERVRGFINLESVGAMHRARALGKAVYLSEGSPEGYPDPLMHPKALQKLGVVALNYRDNIPDRVAIIARYLNRQRSES
jgi:hypothetical protein